MTDCIFCKIASKEIPSEVVYENAQVFAFRDLHPQAPNHVLIIPKKHVRGLAEIAPEDTHLMGELLQAGKKIVADLKMGESSRLVINQGSGAGQSVFHLHLHALGGRDFAWPPG